MNTLVSFSVSWTGWKATTGEVCSVVFWPLVVFADETAFVPLFANSPDVPVIILVLVRPAIIPGFAFNNSALINLEIGEGFVMIDGAGELCGLFDGSSVTRLGDNCFLMFEIKD